MSLSDQDSWQNRTSITEELGVKNFIVYSVNMSDLTPGTYKARIYAWNKNGYSDYVILNGTITITKQEPGEAPFPVGIVAGVVSSVVALGIAAAIGFFVLRRLRTKDESRSKLNSRSGTGDEDSDDEDEVNTVNPMYVSADEVKSGTSANNEKKKDDVYAMVDKKPKKANVGLDNLYAMPEKKDKKNQKKGDVKKRKKDKPKKETGGDVYENAPVNAIGSGKKTAYEENPYENPEISDTRKAPLRNKDGLIYADLAFNDQPKGQKKLVIHGLDDMTEYVEVDFTKRADPLPDSDEENK
ncbi:uncharacterized protein LOC132758506 [Ruditapes philippinarum]|uniref:uncharacterized protein LOC132758506 n=1 Tax=Ruditapes philippinarum TaxID=129788 RepID=UPI00295C0BF8|nr:uncharacterized protein LOC132758506 [Ruditapes philippinarum]